MAQKQSFGQKKNTFEKRLVGLATVITGDKKAKFTLTEESKVFANESKSLTVLLDDLPKMPKLKPNVKTPKSIRIRVNEDGDGIEAITPVNGVHRGKLIDIGPRPEKDADPTPREKVFDEGGPKENRHWEFFAVYQITEGEYKGVQTPAYNLHYKFEEDPNNPGYAGFTFSLDNRKATRGLQLAEWGNIHKVWEVQGTEVFGEPIEWDDVTILPELLLRATKADVEVDLLFKNGYIDSLIPVESDEEESDDELDDESEDLDEESDDEFDEKFPAPKEVKAKQTPKKLAPTKSAPVKTTAGRNTPKKISKTTDEEDEDDL